MQGRLAWLAPIVKGYSLILLSAWVMLHPGPISAAPPEAKCPLIATVPGLPAPNTVARNTREATLLRCLALGRTDEAARLLDAGARSPWALAYAVAAGHAAALRMLLTRGADPDSSGPTGDVPVLAMAAGRGRLEMVRMLLDAGADPNGAGDQEFSGGSALAAAVRAGELAVTAALLDAGADANQAESYRGETPLWQLVCRRKDLSQRRELITLLIARGADVNARDAGALDGWTHSGRTPLGCAVAAGDRDLARYLLEHGADANALVDGGVRILELAREQTDSTLVALLEAHGATTARPLPSAGEVYAALGADGLPRARSFYMLGGPVVHPERMPEPFPSAYRGRTLVPYLTKDFDGDSQPELAVVLQRPGEKPAALVVAVLGRAEGRWRVLQRRDSHEGNPVRSAALEDTPNGVRVHVFEARYQCDDEQPVQYLLRWDPTKAAIIADAPGPHLHPMARQWDCGE